MLADDYSQCVPGALVQKQLGRPNRLGEHILGWTWLGHFNKYAGIYQKRHNYLENKIVGVKERFYRPTNPQSVPQQAWRQKFADGMDEWASLTPAEKEWYNQRGNLLGMHGVNLFLREYLSS